MEITTTQVILRQLVPGQGKAIKNTVTEEYYPDGVYLGKDEDENNYIEVEATEIIESEASEQKTK